MVLSLLLLLLLLNIVRADTYSSRPHAKTVVPTHGEDTDVIGNRMYTQRHRSIAVNVTASSTDMTRQTSISDCLMLQGLY